MRIVSSLMALAVAAPLVCAAEPVNINTADARTIAKELKGIGVARAQAIVDYRTQHGPFKSPDDLGLVKGIAKKVIDQNRANIKTDGRADGGRAPAVAGKNDTAKTQSAKGVTAGASEP